MKSTHTNMILSNQRRCVLSLALCIMLVAAVFLGINVKLMELETPDFHEVGWRSFRMFTILTSLFSGCCALLCIPFQIDGLRKVNYHLPRWIIYLSYTSLTSVVLTLLVTSCLFTPIMGFYVAMVQGSSIFLHLIVPVLSIIVFGFLHTDHTIPPYMTWLAFCPVLLYGSIYGVQVFLIGESNGGWSDFYHFNTFIPWYLSAVLCLGIAFIVLIPIRLLHNKLHRKQKQAMRCFYLNSDMFNAPNIHCAIEMLVSSTKLDEFDTSNLAVPRRILLILRERYATDESLQSLYAFYVSAYLEKELKEKNTDTGVGNAESGDSKTPR